MNRGSIHPAVWCVCWVRPRLYPPFRKRVPIQMPKIRPKQAKDRVAVAAGQTQRRPPGASEKHKSPDHRESAEDKPDDRR